MKTFELSAAAGLGFLAVALGAFGAHFFKPHLLALGTESAWQTAVFYHLTHALVLLFLSLYPYRPAAFAFLLGVILFSGSLYLLAWTGLKWLGAITPAGGVCLLIGWGLLFFKAVRNA
jgi:uncharacterized membrane protein YgdD (TMEM256/DUF423 family)